MLVIEGLERQIFIEAIKRYLQRHSADITRVSISVWRGEEWVELHASPLDELHSNEESQIGVHHQDALLSFFVSFNGKKTALGGARFDEEGKKLVRRASQAHEFFDVMLTRSGDYDDSVIKVFSGPDDDDAGEIFEGTWGAFKNRGIWNECIKLDDCE